MSLFIAVPVYRRAHPAHEESVRRTLQHFGGRAVSHRVRGDSCLSRARAGLLGEYLLAERNWTHFLQTDDDQSWDPAHLDALCGMDYPVVGLPCAFKSDRPEYRGRSTVRFLDRERPAADGTIRVRYLGGGFILWRRDVLDELCRSYPERAYDTNVAGAPSRVTWDLWTGGVVDREYLSEDYWACHLATALGYEIRCSLRYCSPHWSGDPDLPDTWRAWVPSGYDAVDWGRPIPEAA